MKCFILVLLSSNFLMVLCKTKTSKYSEDELQYLHDKLDAVLEQNDGLKKENGELTSKLNNLQNKVDAVLEQNKVTLDKNMELKKDVEELKLKSRKTRQLNASTVAFTVQLTHNIPQLGSSQTIEFDQVLTNIGNAYQVHQGEFTAPVAGVYHFLTTVMAYGDENVHIQMVKNGAEIARAYTSHTDFESAVAIAIVQLNAGDKVWVRHFADAHTPHIPGLGYTTFSGFLITSEIV